MLKLYSFTFNPFQENTYILSDDNKDAIIIDPGMYFEEENSQLQEFIEKEVLVPKKLLLTHAHIDHIVGLNWVYQQYHLGPYLHPNEQIILENGKATAEKYNIDYEAYRGPIHFITEDDKIQLGNDLLEILFVPGHSPGSLVFYCVDQQFIIAGDTLFHESIGRTDLPFGNHTDLINHINKKLLTLPEKTKVFPGHGISTTIEHEKINNAFL